MMTTERLFRIGDQVRMATTPGAPWTVTADDTNQTPVDDPEPAYELTQARRNHSGGRDYVYAVRRYAYESDLMPAAESQTERAPVVNQVSPELQ